MLKLTGLGGNVYHLGARWKVEWSSGDHECLYQMATHPIVVKIYQCGPKWCI